MYHGLKQKHGKIQGVSMLPFGLVAGFAGEKEIRIIELAENGFTFRTAEKIADPELFRVCWNAVGNMNFTMSIPYIWII